jgi:retron-type reverse transcriptase
VDGSIDALELAWRRVKADQGRGRGQRRVFVRHPYEIALVEVDRARWLEDLQRSLAAEAYKPSPQIICDAPKKFATRPGSILSLEDRVVFAAAVGSTLPQLIEKLAMTDGFIDFSYQITTQAEDPAWLKNRFDCWNSFREASSSALSTDVTHVVIADIAGFYENIDIATLLSDVRTIGAPRSVTDLLSKCLNRWAQVSGKSIPQGHSAADILAKLYLNSVDSALNDLGYRHFRFVDDFRIFCGSPFEAKRAILDLTRQLRTRGLVLNSTKSNIFTREQAQQVVDGRIPIIENVRQGIVAKITEELGADYVDREQAETVLGKPVEEISIDLIEQTYQNYFVGETEL